MFIASFVLAYSKRGVMKTKRLGDKVKGKWKKRRDNAKYVEGDFTEENANAPGVEMRLSRQLNIENPTLDVENPMLSKRSMHS